MDASDGPAAFANWLALQGFGGGSGVEGLARAPRFLRENAAAPGFDLDAWASAATALVTWLDTHPATDCWAAYHAAIRAKLVTVDADFRQLQQLAQARTAIPADQIDGLEADIAAAQTIPLPTACP